MGKFIKNITLLFNFSFIFLHNLHLIYNDLYEKKMDIFLFSSHKFISNI